MDDAKMKKKKRKRINPFRAKVGCVVAVRYAAGGNGASLVESDGRRPIRFREETAGCSFSELWVDPNPHRDRGLALVGKRVRLCFPKKVLTLKSDKYRANTRMLEGEIVSIVDFAKQLLEHCELRAKRLPCETRVELLVDKDRLKALPFLKCVDDGEHPPAEGSAAKRAHENELRIRGRGTAIVQLTLGDPSGIVTSPEQNGVELKDFVARWVLRKRVPSKLPSVTPKSTKKKVTKNIAAASSGDDDGDTIMDDGGKSPNPNGENHGSQMVAELPSEGEHTNGEMASAKKKRKRKPGNQNLQTSRYIGDGNDAHEKQEKNWRWLSGLYNHFPLFAEQDSVPLDYWEQLSYGFIGEVVNVQVAPTTSSSLATVTVKKLVIPEQLLSGRKPYHNPLEIYDDLDMSSQYYGDVKGGPVPVTFEIPIEELAVIDKRVKYEAASEKPNGDNGAESTGELVVTHSYSMRANKIVPWTENGTIDPNEICCHRCRVVDAANKTAGLSESEFLCDACVRDLSTQMGSSCDCQPCVDCRAAEVNEFFLAAVSKAIGRTAFVPKSGDSGDGTSSANGDDSEYLSATHLMLAEMKRVDFDLPPDYLGNPNPAAKPISKTKTQLKLKPIKSLTGEKRRKKAKKSDDIKATPSVSEDMTVFRPTCSRLLSYDADKRRFDSYEPTSYVREDAHQDVTRNLRALQAQNDAMEFRREEAKNAVKNNSRAARASQRRMLRDVAAITGGANHYLDNRGREQQLRFDRSSIHAWGVFADETTIREGELIVEYRGEIIGNAMAEKREQQYEAEKIGSDYMFRIDEHSVCDATKQGNMARFINASCNPNCFTKIVGADGERRIAVYAKRDIDVGEELCYDYKFPIEYDESKRIPCHCGARQCRGYMNWNKKYVAIPLDENGEPIRKVDGVSVATKSKPNDV